MRDNTDERLYRLTEFDSLAELAAWCGDANSPHVWDQKASAESSMDSAWYGSESLEQSIEWAQMGTWNCPELEELTSAYDHGSMGDVPIMTFESDVVGIRANVPAFCAGVPDSMFQLVETPVQRRIVRLLVGKTYSSGVPAEVITSMSKTILAWIASVELHSQVSVEIVLCTSLKLREKFEQDILVTIKRAGAPLDMSEVAFALINPSYFRRLMFRVMESNPKFSACNNYGVIRKPTKSILDDCDLFLPNVMCEGASEAWQKAEKFRRMLNAFIETEVSA